MTPSFVVQAVSIQRMESFIVTKKKRNILITAIVALLILSGASFYGAYYYMYEADGVNVTAAADNESADSSDESAANTESDNTAKISDSGSSSDSDSASTSSSSATSSGSSGSKSVTTVTQAEETVSISIENWGSKTVVYESGDTVYSVLARCGAPVYVEDSVYGKYIVGINGLMEGDKGSSSGWIYKVNGSMPSLSADKCKVNTGDKIVWSFVS